MAVLYISQPGTVYSAHSHTASSLHVQKRQLNQNTHSAAVQYKNLRPCLRPNWLKGVCNSKSNRPLTTLLESLVHNVGVSQGLPSWMKLSDVK